MDSVVHGILQAGIMERVSFPSPGDLPSPGIEPMSPTLQADSLPAEPQVHRFSNIYEVLCSLNNTRQIFACLLIYLIQSWNTKCFAQQQIEIQLSVVVRGQDSGSGFKDCQHKKHSIYSNQKWPTKQESTLLKPRCQARQESLSYLSGGKDAYILVCAY